MTRKGSLVTLAAVWTAAMLSAAAAYEVHKPLTPPARIEPVQRAALEVQAVVIARPARIEPVVWVHMAPVTIVGNLPHAATPPPAHTIRCSGWSDLSQGPAGGQVRVCE